MAVSHRAKLSERRDVAAAGRVLMVGSVAVPFAVAYFLSVPVCGMAVLAHIPCPGCGLTRATIALLHGDFAGAFALNPLAPVVCPLLAALAVVVAARFVLTGRMPAKLAPFAWSLGVSLGGLTIVWVARWFGLFGGPVTV